ncbi:K Homology domain-containing protein [Caenorhabditis elegans]|uniref:K Homology domain-containing protein n=1 Tax=Caenorhabditis elegans TaxID=6239 RepID=P91393_CAEEL|nr:K Homology domain-containing protein [Caenorhabditis elegans]CCD72087.1 K Homology domain-containing protein [Caenorhabditis elegans]|eukprot:NP_491627.2 FUBp (FUBP) Like [Caenorhabditis elegans]
MDKHISSSTDTARKRDFDERSEGSDEYEEYAPPCKLTKGDIDYRVDTSTTVIKASVSIPEESVGLVIGRNGVEIQAISQKSGCRVQIVAEPSTTGYRSVDIYGISENIEVAKKLINEVVARGRKLSQEPLPCSVPQFQPIPAVSNSSKVTIIIPIPANKCGAIIGKKGEQMRKLRSWTNCDFILIQENNIADSVKPLQITGQPKEVEHAKALVADILDGFDECPPAGMAGNSPVAAMSLQVKVPRSTVGAIMGLQGSNIKKISNETETKIQFMPDDDPKLMERTLVVIGNKNKVYVCARLLQKIVEANSENANTPISLFYMLIPASKCGLVIGRGGETIRQINKESGAYCEMSRDPSISAIEKQFVIRGSETQVEHAKHLIRVKVGDIPPNTPYINTRAAQPLQFSHQNPTAIDSWRAQPFTTQHQNSLSLPQPQAHQFPNLMAYSARLGYQSHPPQHNSNVYASTIQQSLNSPSASVVASNSRFLESLSSVEGASEPGPSLYARYVTEVEQSEKQLALLAAQKADSSAPNYESDDNKARIMETDYSAQWLQYYTQNGDEAAAEAVRNRIAELKQLGESVGYPAHN